MKRMTKVTSVILTLAMMIGMMAVPAIAAESDHSIKLLLEEATVGSKNAIKVDMQVKTSATAIKGAVGCVAFDATVFSLAKPDGTLIELTNSKQTFNVSSNAYVPNTNFTIMNMMSAILDGDTGIVGIQTVNMTASVTHTDYASFGAFYLAFKEGKSISDVTAQTITWAEYAQAAKITFSNSYAVSEASANFSVGNSNSANDSSALESATTIVPSGFEFAKPAYSGTVAAPTVKSNVAGKVELNEVTPSDGGTVQYGYSTKADGTGITWQDGTTFNLTVGSTYYFYAKVVATADYNEKVSEASESVTVADKLQPTCVAPAGVTATYGQLLEEITLTNPAGNTDGLWSWEGSADIPVGNVGEHTFTAKFTPANEIYSEVTGIQVTVTVNPKSISDKTVTIPNIVDQPYTGDAIRPKPYVKDGDTYLKEGTDFTYDYSNNTAQGTATVTITGKGNYTGTVTKDFKIVAAPGKITISGDLNVTYGTTVPDVTVDKKTDTGAVTVYYYTNEACTEGETVTKPVNAGTYYVKAELAAGENYGAATSNVLSFTIARKDIAGMTVALDKTTVEYDGTTKTVSVTSVGNLNASDYDVAGTSGIDADEYTVTVTGKGNYTGTATATWTITAKNVADSMIADVADQPYTGSEIKPEPVITDTQALTKGTDFTYSYEANTYVGTATVTITGKGNYAGTASKTFSITPVDQKPAITATASVTKGGYTVDLKPLVTNAQGTVSFEISGEANGCSITDGVLTSGADTATVNVTVKIAAKNVDNAGADEYNAYTGIDAITVSVVNKQAASLTVTQADGTYGQTLADPTFTAPAGATTTVTYTGTQKDGTAYNSSDKPTQVGDYTVAVKCETDTHIYEGSDAFKIEPKKIAKPTAPSATYTYNGKEQTYALATNDAYTITGTTAATNASSNSITVALKDKNNTTWADGSITDIPFTFVINKATITVKADDIAIKVNETVPAATYTVTGLVNGETLEGVTAAIEGTVDNTKEGQYTITASGAEAPNANYNDIVYVAGKLTISNKNTVITPVGPKPQQPTQPEEPEVTPSFGDIAGEWFEADVEYVAEKGLMNGVGDGSMFAPLMDTSRGMIVTILWRMEGQPVPMTASTFKDVEKGAYYEQAVAWAAEKGIVNGYGDTFGPNDNITREQFATILFRYAQFKGYDVSVGEDTNILSYADAFSISEYAIPAMQWACGAGLINGIGDTLQPAGAASRAQAAAILHRFCENVIQ